MSCGTFCAIQSTVRSAAVRKVPVLEEILRRISDDAHFGEYDEVRALIVRSNGKVHDLPAVGLEIADDRIGLGECDLHQRM
jgi:hypothetical protein